MDNHVTSNSCGTLVNDHCTQIENILIIEDQEFLLKELHANISEHCTVNCDIAANEAEARVLLDKNPYDLIILDIYLPDSSGNFIGALIRKHCRIVIITGRDAESTREKLVALPIVDYVPKTDQKTLTTYLRETIERLNKNRNTTLAICDDSKLSRLRTIDVIKNQNLPYVEFVDGAHAYNCIVNEGMKIDLLITDVNMPNMSGDDLIRKLRHSRSKNELPILAFSDSDKKSTVSQLLKLGANDYVSKPISNEEFIIRLNSTIEQYRLHHENEKLISELHDAATTDFLTKLYNRSFFHDAVKHIISQARRDNITYGVLMLDIDHFKRVNDNYGHAAGDIAIKTIANLIRNRQRDSDIACRWGGEEFLILVQKTTLTQLVQFAERIRTIVEETPIVVEPTVLEFSITVSIGVAIGDDDNVNTLIDRADTLLYQSKKAGRNRVSSVLKKED